MGPKLELMLPNDNVDRPEFVAEDVTTAVPVNGWVNGLRFGWAGTVPAVAGAEFL